MKKDIIFLILFFGSHFCIPEALFGSLYDILHTYPDVEYYKCLEATSFKYPKFPLSLAPHWQPNEGLFAETFILKIPQGKVFTRLGFVQIGSTVIEELFTQNYPRSLYQNTFSKINLESQDFTKVPGKVAVITRIDHDCYGHWVAEILPRLLLLHKHNIAYDWLYVPKTHAYIKESLALLGVNLDKIIEPFNTCMYVQADELIVPSLTARQIPRDGDLSFTGYYPATFYCPNWCIALLREAFLPLLKTMSSHVEFSKKVFISRKDAYQRRMINEDEIFALFEKQGFKRYQMTDLTFLEQVALFHNAKHIVAAHGSCLTNLIFCEKNTHVLEIFQNQFDSGFWQLSGQLGLNHTCLKTQEYQNTSWKIDTLVPVDLVKQYVKNLN